MKEIIQAWGLNGCIGVAGCYLVISGIVGRLIRVPPIMRNEIRVARRGQRLTLGVFGLVLALPILLAAYRDAVFGVKTVVKAPEVPEFVEAPKPLASAFLPVVYWSEGCDIKEAFGLEEHQSRQLQYAPFRGSVFVGVNGIYDIYLKIDQNQRDLKVKQKGEYFDFNYGGRRYRLTVTGIYAAMLGRSKLSFSVCEL
jgi:hypothetical protein